jgi:two-component system phosphate regulon response regulator OmpR
MVEQPHILIVDDDLEMQDMVAAYLARRGFMVHTASNGASMRATLTTHAVALVVLDLCLPGEDGLCLTRFLRQQSMVGIIMLTGVDEVADRIVGLEMGADDYLTKPFDPRELVARIHSVLRRHSAPPAMAMAAEDAPSGVRIGRCRLHLQSHTLHTLDGQAVPLTAMEFALLQTFATHPQRVLSREQLAEMAHDREWEPCDRSLDIRIARLRRKIEVNPDQPQAIKTVHGRGYMFVPCEVP